MGASSIKVSRLSDTFYFEDEMVDRQYTLWKVKYKISRCGQQGKISIFMLNSKNMTLHNTKKDENNLVLSCANHLLWVGSLC